MQGGGLDLRRRTRLGVDHLLRRAAFLPADERALIESIYKDGITVARLARLGGGSREARRLRQRVRLIVKRALSASFASMARCMTRGSARSWPRLMRRVGEMVYFEGKPMRGIARELGVTVYQVRAHRAAIETLFASEGP